MDFSLDQAVEIAVMDTGIGEMLWTDGVAPPHVPAIVPAPRLGLEAARGLLAVLFQGNGQQFDEAWGGSFTDAVTGKRVRLYGELQEYGGQHGGQ